MTAADQPAPLPYGAVVLTAVLATALRLLLGSVAPFPYAPRVESAAFSLLLYALALMPALLLVAFGPRGSRLAWLLLGAPFGLLAISLLVAAGYSSPVILTAVGLTGFPAGVVLALGGSTRRLLGTTLVCVVLATAARMHPLAAGDRRPSVLLIVLDTTATGHLSAYGYERPTTPTLDRLARRSLVYRRAISPASWTIPAHAAIFSGLYPSQFGFDGATVDARAEPGSLAGDLEKTGRAPYAISANPLLGTQGALRVGYRALWRGDRLTQPLLLQLLERLRPGQEFETRGEQITDLALDWLDRLAPRGAPWFLFLNYVDPHTPYYPPERERDAFAPGVDAGAVDAATKLYMMHQTPLDPAMTVAMRALYDGEVAAMDHAIGRLLGELGRRGYDASNLYVIVTADHGEALGEHGLIGHLRGLPDTVLHVPLLVSGPKITPGVVTSAVQTVQLRATVRALLGLPPLRGIAPALPPWGRAPSLVITEHPEPRWYYDELRSWNARYDGAPWASNWVAVERAGIKVVFDDHGRGRTYRLASDPGENHPRPLAEGASLVRAYRTWERQRSDDTPTLSPETRRALESLGYVQ